MLLRIIRVCLTAEYGSCVLLGIADLHQSEPILLSTLHTTKYLYPSCQVISEAFFVIRRNSFLCTTSDLALSNIALKLRKKLSIVGHKYSPKV